METALRTRDRQKIAFVGRILRGAVVSFEEENLTAAEEYLYLISDLTPQELRVALSVYKQIPVVGGDIESSSEAWKVWAENASKDLGLDVVDLRFALGRLVSSGLLDRVTLMGDRDEIVFTEPEQHQVGVYRITLAFEKLMKFVEREGKSSN